MRPDLVSINETTKTTIVSTMVVFFHSTFLIELMCADSTHMICLWQQIASLGSLSTFSTSSCPALYHRKMSPSSPRDPHQASRPLVVLHGREEADDGTASFLSNSTLKTVLLIQHVIFLLIARMHLQIRNKNRILLGSNRQKFL